MTDHKFTDDEIIKALRCCDENDCYPCRYRIGGVDCRDRMQRDALALINRLQEVITLNSKLEAENAKLQRLLDFYEETSGNKKAKAEAIKEFAERLKKRARMPLGTLYGEMVYLKDIDTLVKEMTEGQK